MFVGGILKKMDANGESFYDWIDEDQIKISSKLHKAQLGTHRRKDEFILISLKKMLEWEGAKCKHEQPSNKSQSFDAYIRHHLEYFSRYNHVFLSEMRITANNGKKL